MVYFNGKRSIVEPLLTKRGKINKRKLDQVFMFNALVHQLSKTATNLTY